MTYVSTLVSININNAICIKKCIYHFYTWYSNYKNNSEGLIDMRCALLLEIIYSL